MQSPSTLELSPSTLQPTLQSLSGASSRRAQDERGLDLTKAPPGIEVGSGGEIDLLQCSGAAILIEIEPGAAHLSLSLMVVAPDRER